MKQFKVVSVNISEKTGTVKHPVDRIVLEPDKGIAGDAHAGPWHRQVSLLAEEDIDTMRQKAKGFTINNGDFAENITTQGIELHSLPVGVVLKIGDVELEVTQIGKECHSGCAIRDKLGDCIMPRRGIFAKVITGGEITHESVGTYDL